MPGWYCWTCHKWIPPSEVLDGKHKAVETVQEVPPGPQTEADKIMFRVTYHEVVKRWAVK